jgi:hypothetical protein
MEVQSDKSPRPGAECSSCGKQMVFEHPDGALRHCFSCGENIRTEAARGISSILGEVFRAAHAHVLTDAEMTEALTAARKIHRQLMVDSMIGLLPPEFSVTDLFAEPVSLAEQQLEVVKAPRGRGRPSKGELHAIALAERHLDRLQQAHRTLGEFAETTSGQLLAFYTNSQHEIVRVRTVSLTDAPTESWEWGSGGVFNQHLFAPSIPARSLSDMRSRLTLVPSELDVLQLQSVAAHLAEAETLQPEAGYIKAAAVGLGPISGATVKALQRMPWVIRDSARPESGYRIVEELRQNVNAHVSVVPAGITLADRLRYETTIGAEKALLQLASAMVLVTRPFSAARKDVDYWRGMEGKEAKRFESHRWASRELLQDIQERAELFYDGRTAYVFDKSTKQLLPVDRDNVDTQLFLDGYGISPVDDLCRHALSAIRLTAQDRGTQIKIHSFSHYDEKTNRLYLFDHHRHIYRISATAIEKVDNGTDGVLFVRNPKWEPFEIGTPVGDRSAVIAAIIGSVGLKEEFLTRADQHWLFQSWLHAMLFPELFPTRPILAMIGTMGSGKTSVLRRIGQLLFGPKFQVMGMSDDPKDFDAAVTGEAFVAVDNADADVKWLDDKLAVVATGGTLKRRVLYTTNQLVEFPITAFVGITSRTPHFKREDVADRLLLFHVERLASFESEGTLLGQLTSRRNTLMTELVGEVQRVLAGLDKTKGKAYPTTFRIADFAQFVLRIADAEGRVEEAKTMFARLGAEQLAFTVQDDVVMELLEEWITDHAEQEVTTAHLFESLRARALSAHPPRAFDCKSVGAFGLYLQRNRATLTSIFGASDRTVGGRKRLWKFSPSAPTVTEPLEPRVEPFSEDDRKWYAEWPERSMG